MMRYLIILAICIIPHNLFSQLKVYINESTYEAKTSIGFVGGINGFQSFQTELGIGLNFLETRPVNSKFTKPFLGISAAAELFPFNESIVGHSVNIWMNGLLVLGINQSTYYSGSNVTWALKPFIGLEFFGTSLIYGYEFFLTENEIPVLNHHKFAIRYYLPTISW